MAGTSSRYKKKKTDKDPSYRKKKPLDFYPVQRKINLKSGSQAGTAGLIDLAAELSKTNRRLYRNGKMYHCKLSIDPTVLPSGAAVEVWALRPNWSNVRAWELAKENFDQSYSDERENISKSQQARWFDFRVNHGLGIVNAFTAWSDNDMSGSGGYGFTTGEFDLSVVEDQTGTNRTFTWNSVGSSTEYAILKEFSEGYRAAQTPAFTSGDGPYDQLHADSSQAESEALQDRGNKAPYASTVQVSSIWTKVGTLAMGATGGTFSTGFFQAPCGFIALRVVGAGDAGSLGTSLIVEAQSGDYKGVKAHNMQRM